MAQYHIKTPDGAEYMVEAADDAAAQRAAAHIRGMPAAQPANTGPPGQPTDQDIQTMLTGPGGPGAGVVGQARDPKTRQPLPEGPFSGKGLFMSGTGGFNREAGNIASWLPRLAEGLKNDFITPDAKTNYVNEFMDRNYNSVFDPSQPQNGWERGMRRGGEVLADTMAMMAGQGALAGRFGRGAPQQNADLATTSQRAVEQNPAAFPTNVARQGASEAQLATAPAVPGMGVGRAAAETPQMLLDAAKARPEVVGGLNAASSVGSGMGEQFGGEHAENPQTGQTIGSLLGGLIPNVYGEFVSPAMWAGKGVKALFDSAKSRLPAAADMEARQAEKLAFSNREGKFADPNVSAPKEPGMWSDGPFYKGYLPTPSSWVTKQRDEASALRRNSADEKVGKQIQEWTSHPDAQAASARADELEQAIPGYKPGLAERYNIAPLTKKAEEVDQNLTGNALIQQRERKAANQKAIDTFSDNAVPKIGHNGGPSMSGFQPADEAVGNNARELTLSQEQTAAREAAPVYDELHQASRALPDAPPQQTGAQIREGYDTARGASSAEVDARRQAVLDATQGRTFSGERVRAGIQQDMQQPGMRLLPDELPASAQTILGNTETPGVPRTGQEATLPRPDPQPPQFGAADLLKAQQDIREQIRDLRNGRIPQRDTNQIARLQMVERRLNAEWEGLGGQEARQEFDRYYGQEHAPKFREGLGADTYERDNANYGGRKLEDSDITKQVLSDSEGAARQNLAVNPTGVGRQGTVTANLDDMRRAVVDKNGVIKEGAVREYINDSRNRVRLAEDPELRTLLENRDVQGIYDRLNQRHYEIQRVKESELAQMFAEGARGDKGMIDRAWTDPATMRSIKNAAANDPDLDAALKRAAWERATKNPEKALRGDSTGSFNIVFGDNSSHLADLRAIADAKARESVRPSAAGKAEADQSIGEFLKNLTGTSIPSALSQGRAVAQGRQGGAYTAANVAVAAANKMNAREMEQAWREAFTNPDLARVLAAGVKNGRITPMMEKKISSYILLAPNTQNKGTERNDIVVHPRKGASK